jgi:hypothetical protein
MIFSQLDYIKTKKFNPTLNTIERGDLIASLIYLGQWNRGSLVYVMI